MKMFAAKPNRKARTLVNSAMADLREAAKYDAKSEQVKTNVNNITALVGATRGNWAAFALWWAPIWLVALAWSALMFLGLLAIGNSVWLAPVIVVSLWGAGYKAVAIVIGIVVGIVWLVILCKWMADWWARNVSIYNRYGRY
jgi:hypothetical protein